MTGIEASRALLAEALHGIYWDDDDHPDGPNCGDCFNHADAFARVPAGARLLAYAETGAAVDKLAKVLDGRMVRLVPPIPAAPSWVVVVEGASADDVYLDGEGPTLQEAVAAALEARDL